MAQISLSEIFDDLCSRFIFNAPEEEFSSFERVFFLIEEAHWFYDDFYRERFPRLPAFSLKDFASQIFSRSPFLLPFQHAVNDIYLNFNEYKFKVPVMGCILLNPTLDKVVLVKGWKSSSWGFPRGKIAKDEEELSCAVREVWEEAGIDVSRMDIHPDRFIEIVGDDQHRVKLFIVLNVPESVEFCPQTRKEISKVEWHSLNDLPTTFAKNRSLQSASSNSNSSGSPNRYYMIVPFIRKLKTWIRKNPLARQHSTSPSASPSPTPVPTSPNHKKASSFPSPSSRSSTPPSGDEPCEPRPGPVASLTVTEKPIPSCSAKTRQYQHQESSSRPSRRSGGSAPKQLFSSDLDCHTQAHKEVAPSMPRTSSSGFSFRFNQEEILSCLS